MIGAKIEQRMTELGITSQTELARRSGLSVALISALIRGTRGQRLSLDTAQALSRALRVPQKFFRDEGKAKKILSRDSIDIEKLAPSAARQRGA